MWECQECGTEHEIEETACCGYVGCLEWRKPRPNIDHYLDDPRRGQAEDINRSNQR